MLVWVAKPKYATENPVKVQSKSNEGDKRARKCDLSGNTEDIGGVWPEKEISEGQHGEGQ